MNNLVATSTGKFRVMPKFDIEAFRKSRQKSNPKKNKDLEATLREIDPRIADLAIGAALPLKVDPALSFRANIMRVRAPLTNIVLADRPWAGRSFEVVGNEEDGVIYIYRGEDVETPRTRKPSTRGKNKAKPLGEALADAQAHLNGGTNAGETTGSINANSSSTQEEAARTEATVTNHS